MEAYTDFSYVYDEFMEETPYDEWCDRIRKLLAAEGITDGLILELGCGTGAMTVRMRNAGFDMIGADISESMLQVAMSRDAEGILYLQQDMREFELYGTVRAIYSCCDSVNYLTDPQDVVRMMELVNNYLDPGGLFIFDFNTPYKYGTVIGNTVIAENREDKSFIWENYWYNEERVNEYDLTVYVREEDGRYRRFTEEHYQRGYSPAEMITYAEKAGMKFVAGYDDYTEDKMHEESQRVVMVLREQGKE